jgi:hypothetical protein
MRILKEGKLPADYLWYGKCAVCGAVLEVFQNEVGVQEETYQNRGDPFAFGKCGTPGCKHSVTFHRADSPMVKEYVIMAKEVK